MAMAIKHWVLATFFFPNQALSCVYCFDFPKPLSEALTKPTARAQADHLEPKPKYHGPIVSQHLLF